MFKSVWVFLLCFFAFGCMYGGPTPEDEDFMKKYPNIADDHRQPVVPRTAQVIPRTGAWTGDNQLGNVAPYAPDNRGTQTILKMDEWGPPDVWTVSLYLDERFTAFDGFNVWAEVNFGVGGGTQTMEVDWINGTQFSLPMNAINVIAHFENVNVATEGNGLKLGVQVARGKRGGGLSPKRTISEDAAGNISLDRIPPFAKRIVMAPSLATAAAVANFYSTDTRLTLFSGNTVGASRVIEVDGAHSDGSVLAADVVGQAKYVSAGYFGLNLTYPRFTLYAELDG